jgi:antitoxin MazE
MIYRKNYRKNIMLAVIQKWGNHQGLSFTPEMLIKAQLSLGDEVSITVQPGEIIIKSSQEGKGQYTLAELIAQMPSNYNPFEEDWGPSVGKEIW